ncbi:hypothetical protein Are01nite_21630 [Actinoplanes regularis]|nr:hypothetical protein Are01nite_21630 [Actinoplanes regularis]
MVLSWVPAEAVEKSAVPLPVGLWLCTKATSGQPTAARVGGWPGSGTGPSGVADGDGAQIIVLRPAAFAE